MACYQPRTVQRATTFCHHIHSQCRAPKSKLNGMENKENYFPCCLALQFTKLKEFHLKYELQDGKNKDWTHKKKKKKNP